MIGPVSRRRRGFIAVVLVMTLAFLTILAGSLLQTATARSADLKAAERRLQAEWLAESGLDRALARLGTAPDYRGETWEIASAEFAGRGDASVVITVEPIPDQPDLRLIRARADYPRAATRRARETRKITIDLSIRPKGDEGP